MAEIKRVSDSYTISAPVIVFDGNVQINGTNSVVDTITTVITDNSITLNSGETGAGVSTLGTTAQIVVDRGSLPDVSLRWNESTTTWQVTSDGSSYLDIITGSGTVAAAGNVGEIQYNSAGVIAAEAGFSYDDVANNLYVGNVTVGNDAVTNVATNGNLSLSANGTGTINMSSVAAMDYQGSTPGSTASKTKIYAATPGAATSGVYFVNTVDSDELVSKKRAIMFGLVMR